MTILTNVLVRARRCTLETGSTCPVASSNPGTIPNDAPNAGPSDAPNAAPGGAPGGVPADAPGAAPGVPWPCRQSPAGRGPAWV
ncbi:hypothetical protein GCM10027161_09630 [Microbispora hainanensis]